LNHVSFFSAGVEARRVVTEVEVTQLVTNVNHVRIVVVVSERLSIFVEIVLMLRESLMILRLFDVADVLSGHVAPESRLNFHDKSDLNGVSE
jgi:hypothetical protein